MYIFLFQIKTCIYPQLNKKASLSTGPFFLFFLLPHTKDMKIFIISLLILVQPALIEQASIKQATSTHMLKPVYAYSTHGYKNSSSRYSPPISEKLYVEKPFNKPAKNWLPGHRGVDLRISPGSYIYAPSAGTIHFSGSVAGKATVSIQHPDGVRTTYQIVEGLYPAGTVVEKGEAFAIAQESVLHWGAIYQGEYINPLSLLGKEKIRLKPIH